MAQPVTEEIAEVDQVVEARDALRDEARRRLGVTGENVASTTLREAFKRNNLSWYPLSALGLLAIVDTLHGYAFTVLTPEISRAIGIDRGEVAGLRALAQLASALAPLPLAAFIQAKARRASLALVTGVIWSLAAIANGFVVEGIGLLAVLIVDSVTTASTTVAHRPLLFDSYPPESRVRVISAYLAVDRIGNVIAPLSVALLTATMGFTWRGVFVVFGITSLMGVLAASRLRDPGFGRFDTDEIRRTVHERQGIATDIPEADVTLGFFEIVRRLLMIPSVRRLLVGFTVFGLLTIPFQTFFSFFLEEKWNLGPGGRGLFVAAQAAVSTVALLLYGRRGEALFREDPAKVVERAATYLAIGVVLIGLGGLSPAFLPMVALFLAASALLGLLGAAFGVSLLSIIPAQMRPHATALLGIALAAGGVLGALFFAGIDRRYGIAGAMVAALAPGVAGALVIRTTGRLIPRDLDRMIDEVLEDTEIRRISDAGGHLPLLSCRGIDFSYGPLQVLFDVDFQVDDGEVVALLGTNGAGKSTLLRVISGLGLPSKGSVRFRGADITFLDAERRLRLGITQIPGGRAVFGNMSVVDNLRAFSHSVPRRQVEAGIERSFAAFPQLAARRDQVASTLSGGEQQMLGLSKALILRPRLLLIDELSLGLAPVIVGQLLDMVREINNDGTAVVLVEQSVNIALNLAEHAYFMEKGEIRFDGRSADLLGRDDLLRAVFLGGNAPS